MIPKHLHFIFFLPEEQRQESSRQPAGGKRGRGWGLVDYVCVRSAVDRIRPDAVSFYLDGEPSGPWWELTRPLVDLVSTEAPTQVFGNAVTHLAHKADVIRLERLIQHGGIYLDTDVLVHRSFDPLLDNSVVMGREGATALCNAVILAEKDAPFLSEWYANYRTFDGAQWNRHSVLLPFELAQRYGDEVKRLSERAFFWPDWQASGIHAMFGARDRPGVRGEFANHLWGQRARDYILDLTPGHVRGVNTPFHAWARPFLEGLPDSYGGGTDTRFLLRRDLYANARSMLRIGRERIDALRARV